MMKARMWLETTYDCPQESDATTTRFAYSCNNCGCNMEEPDYLTTHAMPMGDNRRFASLYHPTVHSYDGKPIDCPYAGRYFLGPVVELKEVKKPE